MLIIDSPLVMYFQLYFVKIGVSLTTLWNELFSFRIPIFCAIRVNPFAPSVIKSAFLLCIQSLHKENCLFC